MNQANPSAGEAQVRLYSPTSVWLAAFIGSVPGGAVLLAANYRKLRNARAARQTLLYGLLVTLTLLAVAVVITHQFLHGVDFGVEIIIAMSMYRLAQSYQGTAFEEHIRRGGLKASNWQAAGIGLLCLLGLCGVLFAAQVLVIGPLEGGGPKAFTDARSGFMVTRPQGWFLETGEPLRHKLERRNPALLRSSTSSGSSHEIIARLVHHTPLNLRQIGVVVIRFDWAGFSSQTDLDALLRKLLPSQSSEPTTVQLGGRSWRAVRTQQATMRGGRRVQLDAECYVTAGEGWALQMMTVHPHDERQESQALFAQILQKVSFEQVQQHL